MTGSLIASDRWERLLHFRTEPIMLDQLVRSETTRDWIGYLVIIKVKDEQCRILIQIATKICCS